MNSGIKSSKSSHPASKEKTFGDNGVFVLFPKSFNALPQKLLKTTNQKPARFMAVNDHNSSSGFLSGEYLNVNTYVNRRLPPGRDPCGHRRRKSSGGL